MGTCVINSPMSSPALGFDSTLRRIGKGGVVAALLGRALYSVAEPFDFGAVPQSRL